MYYMLYTTYCVLRILLCVVYHIIRITYNVVCTIHQIIYIYIYSPNKGGTTGVGFLLALYRITFVHQDFPSPPTCLDLPRLA